MGQPPGQCFLASAVDLVLEERLQELKIAGLVSLGLLQAKLQGVEHPAQAQDLQVPLQLVGHHRHHSLGVLAKRGKASLPRRWAGTGRLSSGSSAAASASRPRSKDVLHRTVAGVAETQSPPARGIQAGRVVGVGQSKHPLGLPEVGQGVGGKELPHGLEDARAPLLRLAEAPVGCALVEGRPVRRQVAQVCLPPPGAAGVRLDQKVAAEEPHPDPGEPDVEPFAAMAERDGADGPGHFGVRVRRHLGLRPDRLASPAPGLGVHVVEAREHAAAPGRVPHLSRPPSRRPC